MLKLLIGNPYVLLGIGALILVLGCGDITFWALWRGASTSLDIVTKDRDAQVIAVTQLQGISSRQQQTMRDMDERTTASLKRQQEDALKLASQNQSLADDRDSLLARIKDAAHDHDTTVIVSGVSQGWDPLILAGMRCLRGVQLGRDLSAPDCRIQATDGAGGSGSVGSPTGANPPRPSAEQQADFLAFAWRLRDWGASCYADKRAIAAGQQP